MTDHEELVSEYEEWARAQFLEDVQELYMDNDHVKEPAQDKAYERSTGLDTMGAEDAFDAHYRAALDAYSEVARKARVVFDD